MDKVIIYTKDGCPYCFRAKALLDSKGAAYKEIDVGNDPEKRQALSEKSNGRKTVPQIFIMGKHIGGCDDLFALEHNGELESLLSA